jgi:hypothetical protein
MRAGLAAVGMAVLAAPWAAAQTPPVPNFTLAWHPDLAFNVWPGDFNEDGRTDLVAAVTGGAGPFTTGPGDIVVAIGNGNGTFQRPSPVGVFGYPLNVADFNADGFVDLVVLSEGELQVLAGNGDGTFDPPRVVDSNDQIVEIRAWAHVADFDGDGRHDLLVPTRDDANGEYPLLLYRGNGNFTFGAPVPLPAAQLPWFDATSGDFNGDGRRDIAAIGMCCEVNVFLNNGSGGFTRTQLTPATEFTDVTTADMNGDGRLDLIATSGHYAPSGPWDEFPGAVYIFLGSGAGGFAPGVAYDTGVRGETSVVTGDFNGDGRRDVATSNRSMVLTEDFGGQLFDSVSILPGDGTGRLLTATTYALARVSVPFGGRDPNYPYGLFGGTHQLNTSDLNGDGRTDLIASPGVTLLNRAPAANRPPSAFAGPDRTDYTFEHRIQLVGEGTDPDMHWLSYRWTDSSGRVIGTLPWVLAEQARGTVETYTLRVEDGRGGVASDSVTIRTVNEGDPYLEVLTPSPAIQAGTPYTVTWFATDDAFTSLSLSYSSNDGRTFTTVPGCGSLPPTARQCTWSNPGPVTERARLRIVGRTAAGDWTAPSGTFSIIATPVLPAGWAARDIGAVAAAGTTRFANGTWTLEGSGADIWDVADEFRFAYRTVGGNFTITARVASIENVNRWVKAGLMLREGLGESARHVSLFATPTTTRGLAFQRRLHFGGFSAHTSGPAVAPPVWLRVSRVGNTISAYYRTSATGLWTLVARETVPHLVPSLYIGMAVSSHVDGTLATAVFDNVAIESHPLDASIDIGAVGVPGQTTFDGVVYEVRASGADIWGTADAFRYTYASNSGGDGRQITARVRSIEPTDPWAKAGVMFREFSGFGPDRPGLRHVMVVVTPGKGVAMQYRDTENGPSTQLAVRARTAPAWVRLTREANSFTGWTSQDGVTWQRLGTVTFSHIFAVAGLAVTSHDNSRLTTASFDSVELLRFGQ